MHATVTGVEIFCETVWRDELVTDRSPVTMGIEAGLWKE